MLFLGLMAPLASVAQILLALSPPLWPFFSFALEWFLSGYPPGPSLYILFLPRTPTGVASGIPTQPAFKLGYLQLLRYFLVSAPRDEGFSTSAFLTL